MTIPQVDASISGLNQDAPLPLRVYAILVAQLTLATVVVWQLEIEKSKYFPVAMAIVACGFALHAQLPFQYRLAAFLVLSIGCLILALGIGQAACALLVAGFLIGISLLPVAFSLRLVLLAMAAAALVWLRHGSHDAYWPIVGSMFMFRLIIYMYDSRRIRGGVSLLTTLSYFLLLPNIFFYRLFPVVDYRTFHETYYNDRCERIYQSGIHWIVVGVVHLLLYRFISAHLVPMPFDIQSYVGLVQFLVMNYALYLSVSGQFHLICGVLHLFGFNLPRTHNCYFLASSFSDIWRRSNIYWKDFMTKIFFLPAMFKLRAFGKVLPIVPAVLWVFLWTWLAHSWQLYWLKDQFPLNSRDGYLWLGVGTVVAVSWLWDYHRALRGALRRKEFSIRRATVVSLQTIGVLMCVSLFWARWSMKPDMFRYLLYESTRLSFTTRDALVLGGVLAIAIVGGVAAQFASSQAFRGRTSLLSGLRNPLGMTFEQSAAVHLAALSLVLLLGSRSVHSILGEDAERVLAVIGSDTPKGLAMMEVVQSYYEELNSVESQASPVLGNTSPQDLEMGKHFRSMTQPRRDLLELELIPSRTFVFDGVPLSTNRWCMRDCDRELEKPHGRFRIALVGSSCVMGYGVRDEETFACLLEEQLNEKKVGELDQGGLVYEVLNFGVGGYYPLHRRAQIEKVVIRFHPDLIIYVAHQDESYGSIPWLAEAIYEGIDVEDPRLGQLLQQAGITRHTAPGLTQALLYRRMRPILDCTYRRIAEVCKKHRIALAWVYLPMPGVDDVRLNPNLVEAAIESARAVQFDVLDLSDWSNGYRATELTTSDVDRHPVAFGHQRIAARMLKLLRMERPDLLTVAEFRTANSGGKRP